MIFRLPLPERDKVADLDLAISRRRLATRQVLLNARQDVVNAYENYEAFLKDIKGFTSLAEDSALLTKSLQDNFSLLDKGRPLEGLRSHIFRAAEPQNFQCPLCGRAQVCALDHFLPKDQFPEYSILVDNLIPVCERCNRLKGAECDREGGMLMLHAYYDEFPNQEILFAEVGIDASVSISYELRRPGLMDSSLYRRIERQFDILRLLDFYQMEAVAEITDQVELYDDAFTASGSSGVENILAVLMRGAEKRGVNHWKAALYRGLSRSSEFCSGGYRMLMNNGRYSKSDSL